MTAPHHEETTVHISIWYDLLNMILSYDHSMTAPYHEETTVHMKFLNSLKVIMFDRVPVKCETK